MASAKYPDDLPPERVAAVMNEVSIDAYAALREAAAGARRWEGPVAKLEDRDDLEQFIRAQGLLPDVGQN